MPGSYQLVFKLLGLFTISKLTVCESVRSGIKIIDGLVANRGQFPYQVSLHEKKSPGRTAFFCGGSIYNELYIITAAHCVIRDGTWLPVESIRVVAGDHHLHKKDVGEQLRKVVAIIPHAFNNKEFANDIALVKLKKPLKFTELVTPIKLAPEYHQAKGNAVVSGWGERYENTGIPSEILRFTDVDIISDHVCKKVYEDYYDDFKYFNSSMICTLKGTHDACHGDSGGPLTCYDLENPYLCGVVSFSLRCGDPAYPGVYSEVSHFNSWIKNVTKLN